MIFTSTSTYGNAANRRRFFVAMNDASFVFHLIETNVYSCVARPGIPAMITTAVLTLLGVDGQVQHSNRR